MVMMDKQMNSLRGCLLLLLFTLLSGCADDMESISWNVGKLVLKGTPVDELAMLRIKTSIDGPSGRVYSKMEEKLLSQHRLKNEFKYRLPVGMTGDLSVQVEGLTENRWVLAKGSATTKVGPDTVFQMDINLERDNSACFSGWTCMMTYPRPDTIQAIWAWNEQPRWKTGELNTNPVWTLGNRGLFQQWNGDIWQDLPPLPDLKERQITSMIIEDTLSEKKVWLAAQGNVYQSDGDQWKISNNPSRKLWAAGNGDVWGIALRIISHWNGSAWDTVKPSGPSDTYEYIGIGGTGSSDVWVVGNVILQGSLTSGLKQIGPLPKVLMHAIWKDPKTKTVWMVGRSGVILRGEHPYSEGWESVANPLPYVDLYAIAAVDNSDIWVVGEGGAIVHWNGSQWIQINSGVDTNLRAISIRSANDVWFAGEGGVILHWNGSEVQIVSQPGPDLVGIWGASSDDIWAIGTKGKMFHYDGKSWKAIASGVSYDFTSIWGSRADDIYAVGVDLSGLIFMIHWDGATWSSGSLDNAQSVNAGMHPVVWGIDSSNVYVTAAQGKYFHKIGSKWKIESSNIVPLQDLVSIDGIDANNVWILGNNLNMAKCTSLKCENVPTLSNSVLLKNRAQIRAFANDNIWIASEYRPDMVYRYIDSAWRPVNVGGLALSTIGGRWPNIWLGGLFNSMSYWNGDELIIASYGSAVSLDAPIAHYHGITQMFSVNERELWAVGERGLLMRRSVP